MKLLTAAVKEGNVGNFLERCAEAKRLGLHKEIQVLKLEFARRKISLLYEAQEAAETQSILGVQAPVTKARHTDVAGDKHKVEMQPLLPG